MPEPEPDDDVAPPRILMIGQGRLIDVARRALDDAEVGVVHLREPTDRHIRRAMERGIDAVVVISRDDRASLRLALVVESLQPGVRLIVTIYNRDLGQQVRRSVRNVRVMSMADIVAPSLAAACLADDVLSLRRTADGVLAIHPTDEGPVAQPLPISRPHAAKRLAGNLGALTHPYELSAKTLLAGLLGFLVILVTDTAVVAVALDQSVADALYSATKTIVTVGPNYGVEDGAAWLKVFSAVMMLAALGFTAVFTAGLIERLLDKRLVAITGPRAMPRHDHVVVIGLGQVGLRLCMLLRELGVAVVAVERDPGADNIRRAKQYDVPIVIGRGSSRGVLRRLTLERARAFVSVTSDEIENISAAVAALAINEDLRTVLRAGSGDMMDETRAMFRIGAVRDVYLVGGTLLAAAALGSQADEAFHSGDVVWVICADGGIERSDDHVRALLDSVRAA